MVFLPDFSRFLPSRFAMFAGNLSSDPFCMFTEIFGDKFERDFFIMTTLITIEEKKKKKLKLKN